MVGFIWIYWQELKRPICSARQKRNATTGRLKLLYKMMNQWKRWEEIILWRTKSSHSHNLINFRRVFSQGQHGFQQNYREIVSLEVKKKNPDKCYCFEPSKIKRMRSIKCLIECCRIQEDFGGRVIAATNNKLITNPGIFTTKSCSQHVQ